MDAHGYRTELELKGTLGIEYPGYFFRNCSTPLQSCTSETLRTVRSFEYRFLFFVVFV